MSLSNVAAVTAGQPGAPAIGDLVSAANAAVTELLADCAPGDPMRAGLSKVQQTIQKLTLLTGQLSLASRHAAPRTTALDLNSVVREMVSPLQRLLGPFITLETALHLPGLWVAGDRTRIEQVALGLVINAREALPLGGKVQLATRRWVLEQDTRYRIGTVPAGSWAVLEVHDNGAGVDARSVRDLLTQSNHAAPLESSLSLATVSTVVTEAGGHVILDLPESGGTVLAVCLPAVQPPRARQPATGTANAVLILDDDEWSRTSAARILRHAGFGVLEAGDVEDAFELLDDVAGSCVRLMLVDLKLLGTGSRPLNERLRRERPDVELMVTASHRSSTGGEQAPVLTKPFSPDELLGAIRDRFQALS